MTTPRDILTQALKDCGVLGLGQNADATDLNDAFTRLNWMLAQWSRKRWLVYHLVDVSATSTGAQSYTVGPGGTFNVTVRPDRLEAAFFRQLIQSSPNQVDYPLQILQAREDYNNIALKNLQSFPSYVFYDSDWPLGAVYPWPLPQANIYSLHLSLKMVLSQFTGLSQVINLPPEYYAALHYNMAVRMRAAYPMPGDPQRDAMIGKLAIDALNVLRGANTQIAALTMPTSLARPGVYNPYSDQIR